MKPTLGILAALLLLCSTLPVQGNPVESGNNVQLAILLDTSNSMDGLIDQAKNQLWKIVNELARSHKKGEPINLKVALYEYGNDGLPAEKGHLRMVAPLTNDLDLISEELFKLRTNGGEEYCGRVIKSAVENLKWSNGNDDLKIIVIAGNEPFNQGNIDYKDACKKAITKGIIINTIFCGDFNEGVNTSWKDGSMLADGKYMNIDQNQQIVHVDAPQDDELVRLGQELNKTYISYGVEGKKLKERQEAQDNHSLELSTAVMAQRSAAKAGGQYKNANWDLVDAEEEGAVDLDNLNKDYLPDELKGKNEVEIKQYVSQMKEKREQIQSKINKLNEERRKYVAEKSLENQDNTLDAAMIKTIHEQATKKNFEFKK